MSCDHTNLSGRFSAKTLLPPNPLLNLLQLENQNLLPLYLPVVVDNNNFVSLLSLKSY